MTLHLRDIYLPAGLPAEQGVAGQTQTAGLYARYLKRPLDIFLVLLCAPVALPLTLALLFLVALDGHSPVYRQKRIGRGGRIYSMIKIRSMVPNADRKLQKHLQEDAAARAEWASLQKLSSDPRITPVGRMIRKCSLDELPQLWNVLLGDMSLVGPRPMIVEQKPLYSGKSYFEVRPGVTGLWQVSDRNRSTFADRVRFDETYCNGMSFGNDMKIIARTVSVVLYGTGW